MRTEHEFRNAPVVEHVPMGQSPSLPLTNAERLKQWQAHWDLHASEHSYPRPALGSK